MGSGPEESILCVYVLWIMQYCKWPAGRGQWRPDVWKPTYEQTAQLAAKKRRRIRVSVYMRGQQILLGFHHVTSVLWHWFNLFVNWSIYWSELYLIEVNIQNLINIYVRSQNSIFPKWMWRGREILQRVNRGSLSQCNSYRQQCSNVN